MKLSSYSVAALILASSSLSSAYVVKRQASELRDGGYDFVIAGGGTSGLTVADRLSEAFPNSMFKSPLSRENCRVNG